MPEQVSSEPILKIQKVNYGSLGLRGNPFPISGISTSVTPYPLIDENMDGAIHVFIQDTLKEQEFCGLAILGEFGAGKTYALRYISTLLGTIQMRPDAEEVLAIYVERPRPTMIELVADVCERIGRIKIRNVLIEMAMADLSDVVLHPSDSNSRRLAKLRKDIKEAKFQNLFNQEDLLGHLTSPEAVMNPAATIEMLRANAVKIEMLEDFCHESFCQILGPQSKRANDVARHLAEFALANQKVGPELWHSFLRGRILAKGHLVAEISGQDIWSNVLKILMHAGYLMVYWLIDEFEELESQIGRPTSIRSFLADFRDLIDANLRGFSLVVASKVHPWGVYRQIHAAFAARFSRVVDLPPNTTNDFRRMISKRLGLVRVATPANKDSQDTTPFDPDAIQAIMQVSRGNTRVAVEACHILLWHAASSSEKHITQHTVERLSEINRAFFYAKRGNQ